MQINREQFKEIIQKLLLGVGEKPGQYAPDSIMSDGECLYSFNDVVGVKLKYEPLVGLRFSVHATTLFDSIKAMTTETIELNIKDGHLVLVAGRSRSKIKLIDDKVKQRWEDAAPWDVVWRSIPANLTDVLPSVLTRSTARFSGVFMAGELLVSADTRYAIKTAVDGAIEDCWLANQTADILARFGTVTEMANRASWVYFKNGDSILSVRKLIEANYPLRSIMALFHVPEYNAEGVIPPEMKKAVHSLGGFAESASDGSMVIKVSINPGEVVLTGSRNGVEYESSIETRTNVDTPLTFTCDYMALHKCLKLMPGQTAFRVSDNVLLLMQGTTEAVVAIE